MRPVPLPWLDSNLIYKNPPQGTRSSYKKLPGRLRSLLAQRKSRQISDAFFCYDVYGLLEVKTFAARRHLGENVSRSKKSQRRSPLQKNRVFTVSDLRDL